MSLCDKIISELFKYYIILTDYDEITSLGHYVGKLTCTINGFQDNKLVKGEAPLPTVCFDYQEKVLLASASAGTGFSDDVSVSAAKVEDNNEVIENLSNLAFDESS